MARKESTSPKPRRKIKDGGTDSLRSGSADLRPVRPRRSKAADLSGARNQKNSLIHSPVEHRLSKDILGAISIIFCVMLMLAVISELLPMLGGLVIENGFGDNMPKPRNLMGPLGSLVASFLIGFLGWGSLMWILLLAVSSYRIFSERGFTFDRRRQVLRSIGGVILLSSFSSICAVLFGSAAGGALGSVIANSLVGNVNDGGALIIAFFAFVISIKLSFGLEVRSSVARSADRAKKIVISSAINSHRAWTILMGLISATYTATVAFFRILARVIWAPIRWISKTVRISLKIFRAVKQLFVKKRPPLPSAPLISLRPEQMLKTSPSSNTPKIVNNTRRILASPAPRVAIAERTKAKLTSGGKFRLPSLDLLVGGSNESSTRQPTEELLQNSRFLEKALMDFKIGGAIVEVQPGPVITLYQFEPAPGIKVQRIISLADDLALALKVASVRVYAPVPGKGTVGIEVPNKHRETVRLRDILGSQEYVESKAKLVLALGKDTFGDPFVADLAKMPHLLIAGATGTGKSVCINSLLLSLLFRNTPSDLRLILIDPKMLELSVYEGIPHLKCQVITNPKRSRGVLWWAVEEMERRYNLMKDLGVRNLASYNRAIIQASASSRASRTDKLEEEPELLEQEDLQHFEGDAPTSQTIARTIKNNNFTTLPRIVIVVDELADLMLTVGKEIEELLTRLAQKARAAGIHLILATQRPSVNVITGLIKANFPTRISFQVASRIDSRTVLDTSGSERLLGMGDMLYMSPGVGRLKRMHSAYVSDGEVQEVVEALRSQGEPDYDEAIEEIISRFEESEKHDLSPSGAEEYDPLYDQAVQLVIERGVASTSLVQRVFRIGYNRAARILETMEREGLVGPADGSKPRQILVPNRMID